MDAAVLGTSNCIGPDSFVERLCTKTRVRLQNLSIGACSSNLGLYQLSEINPTTRGIGFIDYSINDSDAGWNLWGESDAGGIIARNIRTIANHLRSKDYLPVVVITPSALELEMDLIAETLHIDACLQQQINFINLRSIFRSALARGTSQSALMRDNFHMSKSTADLVANLFGQVIELMQKTTPVRTPQTVSTMPTRVVPARELFAKAELIELGSTLRMAQYGRLKIGDIIRIPARNDERVAAIMINLGAKGATIALRGKDCEVIKAMTAYWQIDHPESYCAMLVDIGGPIIGGDLGVTIEIVPSDIVPTEPTIHGRPARPERYGEIEIEGVLLTRLHDTESRILDASYDWMPVNLAELPQAQRMVGELLKL